MKMSFNRGQGLRIAFVLGVFPKLSESFILDQVIALINEGHDVTIYSERDPRDTKVHKAVVDYGLIKRTIYRTLPEAASYDLILCHFGPHGVKALGWKDQGLVSGRIVTFFHGYDATSYVSEYGGDCYADLFRRGDLFIVPCGFFKEVLCQLGCPGEKLVVSRIGVDTAKFRFRPRPLLRKPLRIISIGRLIEKKGMEFGIRAVAELVRWGIDVRYEIIGDGCLREPLMALVHDLGMRKNVFLKGEKNDREILAALKDNDILMAPSIVASDGDSESAPVVIKEAMAAGLAVVATKHAGIPEIIKDGYSGFLVEEKDVAGLVLKLKNLIENDQKRVELCLNARKAVEAEWNQQALLPGLIRHLQGLLGQAPEPPCFPEPLPGTLWGMTAYFNPMRYGVRHRNYKTFRENVKRQGLNLLTVELAFGSAPFELKKEDAETLIQRRTGGENVLWQKERLLNIALENLPKECDKIVWLDQDIIFKNDRWIEAVSRELERYKVVQPFSLMVSMPRGKKPGQVDSQQIKFGKRDNQKRYGFAFAHAKFSTIFGHPGYAWAARRSVFDTKGFFDRNILGSGDLILKDAFCSPGQESLAKFFPGKLLAAHSAWTKKMYSVVQGSIGYVEGEVFHLWHGHFRDRRYEERHLNLKKHDFDPDKDIVRDANGVWAWGTPKKGLHRAARSYFWMRNEDGSLLRKAMITVYDFFNIDENQRKMHLINIERRYLQVLGFFGRNMKRALPGAYYRLKKYFPDKVV